jgi:anthranilate phosphoribosyltransferase
MDAQSILARLAEGHSLTETEASWFFETMLTGGLNDVQLGAALAMMTVRGPSVEELVAGATVLRRSAVRVPVEALRRRDGTLPPILDTCGTGGAPKTFNISTAAALVTAAAGRGRLVVVKHGGRSRSGRGSAEILQHLGVNIEASPAVQGRCLVEAGICFAFAVNHHPAMRHAAGARRSLGFPTVMNMIGPLANPAGEGGATRQVIGVFSIPNALKMAQALKRMGTERAFVVASRDGMDELTTTAENVIHEVSAGSKKDVETRALDAVHLGLRRRERRELEAASLEASAEMVRSVLAGRPGAPKDVVALNSAAGLLVCDAVKSLEEGLVMAFAAIDSGAAHRTLEDLVRLSHAG